jgi:hypothetical protein
MMLLDVEIAINKKTKSSIQKKEIKNQPFHEEVYSHL